MVFVVENTESYYLSDQPVYIFWSVAFLYSQKDQIALSDGRFNLSFYGNWGVRDTLYYDSHITTFELWMMNIELYE